MPPVAVIWSGPASDTLDAVALPAGSTRVKIPCTGTAGCVARVQDVLDAASQVPRGVPIILVGFSAGHGANDRAVPMVQPAAFIALDSYYSTTTPAGMAEYARLAADGKAWMVSTTSDPAGASWRTCEQNIQPLLAGLALSPTAPPQGLAIPAPPAALGRGQYLHLPYGGQLAHGQHATVLGPAIIEWVARRLASAPSSQVGWKGPAIALAASVVAYFVGDRYL